MGSDTVAPTKAAEKPSATSKDSKDAKDAKDVKAGRGHRQHGAGTVITAKAPVVTQDGIVLKAHGKFGCYQLITSIMLICYCRETSWSIVE